MHRLKRLWRRYNPPLLLAQEISKSLKVPILHALQKTRLTKSQTRLSAADRQRNLQNSLALAKGINIEGKNILLIDDVHTTGATLKRCSALLKKGGAKRIIALTIASTA